MPTQRPYIPADGARLGHRGCVYMLREVDGQRLLFNVQALTEAKAPSYRLDDDPLEVGHWYRVFSIRTGKEMPGGVVCYMARVYRDRPLPKFPLWQWK